MSDLSAREQYFLELVNRARLDPLNEAARLLADPNVSAETKSNLDLGAEGLNRGLSAGTISGAPLQPLAPNGLLRDAAEGHSDWMLQANVFSHTGQNGSSVGERIADAGYVVVWPGGTGENLSWRGTTGTMNMDAAVIGHHAGLFASDGHRRNILTEWFKETGVAQVNGPFTHTNGITYDSSMLTQKFAASGHEVFLTGVAYTDLDGDNFYSLGEGQAGVGVAAAGVDTLTASAGGYALALTAAPNVSVTMTWGAIDIDATVDLSEGNVKLDLVAGAGGVLRLLSSSDLILGAGALEAALIGAADLSLQGNDAGNLLIGNRGDNHLRGGAGDDTLVGGAGNDTLDGGGGQNTARFSGSFADYLITADGAATIVSDQRPSSDPLAPHDGVNHLTNIRFLEFSDHLHDLAPPVPPGTAVVLSGQVAMRAPGPGTAQAEGVVVRFSSDDGGFVQSTTTDETGAFSFDLTAGLSGQIELVHEYSPVADKSPSILDVLSLFRIVAGVSTASSPSDLFAADYNGNGSADIQDVLALFRHVAGISGAIAPRFVFVEESDMPGAAGLTGLPVPGPFQIDALAGDLHLGFTGILTGDLHGYT